MTDHSGASNSVGRGLRQLVSEGVSPWLDGVRQELITSGQFAHLIRDIGVRGATSNVDMFVDALADDWHYRDRLVELARRGASTDEAIRSLHAHDIRRACTELRDVFESANGLDGLVSVDLDPRLAGDAEATVREATELFRLVHRPNLLVKITATTQGVSAIRDCVGAGIGVHANDIFSLRRYGEVLDAYVDGLALATEAGMRPAAIPAVTSFPVGRIDAAVDARLAVQGTEQARALHAQAALATARLAYRLYEQRLSTGQWRDLAEAGAHPPRLMWTSTATCDPAYPIMWYVNEFVAWGTVNAMPLSMLEAAGQKCNLRGDTLTDEHLAATRVVEALERLGISTAELAGRLEAENARRQVDTWQTLRSRVADELRTASDTEP
jgi:transaldolase